jgi:hypothetical protein
MMFSDGPTCAEAILPRGQENGRRAYRQYGRGLRRTHAAKAPGPSGCAAAAARGVAALARCPASRCARFLAARLAATQRRRVNLITSCSSRLAELTERLCDPGAVAMPPDQRIRLSNDLERYLGETGGMEADCPGSAERQVDHPATHERAAIIDANHHRSPGPDIHQPVRVEAFAIGCFRAGFVIGRQTYLCIGARTGSPCKNDECGEQSS